MKIVLFGATGMVGKGVLLEALDDARVTEVVAISRRRSGVQHPKLREILRTEFFDFSDIQRDFVGVDACFYALGVTSVGMSEAEYTRLTCGMTLAAARALLDQSPHLVFCFVSGQGADSTERGGAMWARVKGKTENALLAMPFRGVYCFRPGVIRPMRGVQSRTRLYRMIYVVLTPWYPLLFRLFGKYITSSVAIGQAMLTAATHGYSKRVLDNSDINILAARAVARRG